MSISQKLIAAFLTAIVLPVALVAIVTILEVREQAFHYFESRIQSEIYHIDQSFVQFFNEVEKDVTYLAQHQHTVAAEHNVRAYLQTTVDTQLDHPNNAITEARAFELYREFGETHPGIKYVYMANSDAGYIQWPMGLTTAGYDPRVRPWYKAAIAAQCPRLPRPPGRSGEGRPTLPRRARSVDRAAGCRARSPRPGAEARAPRGRWPAHARGARAPRRARGAFPQPRP